MRLKPSSHTCPGSGDATNDAYAIATAAPVASSRKSARHTVTVRPTFTGAASTVIR